VFLDCDTGIDDAMALLYLHAHPSVDLVGIGTVSGNATSRQAAANTLALLEMLGSTVPVASGQLDHLHEPFHGGAPHVHGPTGTGRVTLSSHGREPEPVDAAELLIRAAREYEGRLKVIATGPYTNLAIALEREHALPQLVDEVTVMGGAALVPGNITPAAEANVGNDVDAAAAVFAADWSLTMVGLDVTMDHRFTEHHRQRLLAAPHEAARVVGEMLDHYFDFYVGTYGERSSALHDPLAAAIGSGTLVPTLAPVVNVEVDTTDGPNRGRTVADLRGRYAGYPPQQGAHCRVVLAVKERFSEILLETLLGIEPS
jgi:purine nucleosidase